MPQNKRRSYPNEVERSNMKKTYTQNWVAYNPAQQNEKRLFMKLLAEAVKGTENPEYKIGRPRMPFEDMIYSMVFKVYSTFSGRRFNSDLVDAYAKGYIGKKPHYNSVFNYFQKSELTSFLTELVIFTSRALQDVETDFAIDSTGFTTCGFNRWYNHRYGKDIDYKKWIKCHFMCGIKTNIITSVKLTEETESDCKQFKELFTTTARNFDMKEISADKAYSSKENHDLVDALGADPYIMFKKNANGRARGSLVWKRMYHFYKLHEEKFLEHYHKRSNVEATVSMLKRKFGSNVRSKKWDAQVNEVLCKIIAHNICVIIQEMFELGMETNFENINQ